MFKCSDDKKGFTLIEILLVTVILGVLATVGFISYNAYQRSVEIESATRQVVDTLREAQNKAMSVEEGSPWGVRFETKKFILFYGLSYDSEEIKNQTNRLPLAVRISSVSLNGGGDDLVFDKLEGTTSNYGSLRVESVIQPAANYKTVTISQTGKIDVE